MNLLQVLHLVLLIALASGAPFRRTEELQHRIVSLATGNHVSITRSGRVNANAGIDRETAELLLYRDAGHNVIKIGSAKFSDRSWFIVLTEDGKFRGGVPANGNEEFEEVHLGGHSEVVALRLRNYADLIDSGSGSGAQSGPLTPEEETPVCYLGFSTENQRAYCYDNADNINVRLNIIPNLL